MSTKKLEIPDVGIVTIYKRRGVRSVRLSVAPDGSVRVTLPKWAPFKLGIEFAYAKQDWIKSHRLVAPRLLRSGDPIGKAHRLLFIGTQTASSVRGRVHGTEVRIVYPQTVYNWQDAAVQAAAQKASVRALKQQAEALLPQKVQQLAEQYGFTYKNIAIKQLKSRWGSCNQAKELTFNVFLMQLPWHLIEYVILHELQHTTVLRHGPQFWQSLEKVLPNVSKLRKEIKSFHPLLKPTD